MSQPAPQPIWLTPVCMMLSIYTLKLTGHLEALCNALLVFVIVFALAFVGANMLLPANTEKKPPADPSAHELQERLARVERVRACREGAAVSIQWSSSSEEKETKEGKPGKQQNKKEGKLLRKRLRAIAKPDKNEKLGARRVSVSEKVSIQRGHE
jgi:hypothetical protein